MTVERSQGKPCPRPPRPGEHAMTAETALTAPIRDPQTGRFVPGNNAARLRALKRAAKLTTLNPSSCATWARPFVELAHKRAVELVEELGAECSPSLMGFAEAAATADAMHRAYLAIALSPDSDTRTRDAAASEARHWLREHRQSLLSLRGEARAGVPERANDGDDLGALLADDGGDT